MGISIGATNSSRANQGCPPEVVKIESDCLPLSELTLEAPLAASGAFAALGARAGDQRL
jgi:hypothetical protein